MKAQIYGTSNTLFITDSNGGEILLTAEESKALLEIIKQQLQRAK